MEALMGLISVAFSSGVPALYLFLTRRYRKVRNPFALGFGLVVIGGSSLGGVFFVASTCQRMGFALHSPERNLALNTYVITFAIGALLTVWSEFRWRKSVGLIK
jgi:hypothetical protein